MRVEVLKPTNDDWCGSYTVNGYNSVGETMFVEVIFNGNISGADEAPLYRTCVWGNDDCGMEFDSYLEGEVWNKFLQVIGMEFVDMEKLREIGFVSA